jgi:HSP20 family protein
MFGLVPRRKERESARMSLLARNEFPLNSLRAGLEEVFDQVIGRWPMLFENGWMDGYGADIEETEEMVVVRADAPGFEPEDFDIQVLGNTLKIAAKRKMEGKDNTPTIARQLERVLTLPDGVDPAKSEAHYHQGVLELRLPKTEKAKARKIEVKAT